MKKITDILLVLLGALLYAVSIACFLTPSSIAPGGVSGISIMVNYLSGMPMGMLTLLINIPIIAAGFRHLGGTLIKRSAAAVVIFSLIIDFIAQPYFPKFTGDRLLGSIFGGILMGAGLGIIFSRGCTTGGTDIVSLLIKKKFPHLRIGIAMLLTDSCILLLSVLVFKDIESGLYGIIALFCSSRLIDYIVYADESATLVFVFSKHCTDISDRIYSVLRRGHTILSGMGGYSGKSQKIIMCAVRKQEFPALKEIIHTYDENAFIVTVRSEGIFGEGFARRKIF